ncbi:MAG: MazG nucleotide pyrophosphohydrolase domain-containing protein [Alphaproteobacteria bacterium]
MTPLEKMISLEKEAADFGFEWPNLEMILDQAIDECREIKEALKTGSTAEIQEEVGDLLQAAIGVCVYAGFDVEETLDKTNTKFSNRMMALKKISAEKGLETLKGQPIERMLDLWKECKKFFS